MAVDLKLVARRVADGDSAAFRQIVQHTQSTLYRLATRMMGDLADAEDALQDGYVKAYRALTAGNYDGRSSLQTWLYRIVTNACLDALRKRRETPIDNKHEPRFDGELSADARMALRELEDWLGELPPQQRIVLVLRTIEGKSAAEAARILDCSERAVEQRLVRARAALRTRRKEAQAREPR